MQTQHQRLVIKLSSVAFTALLVAACSAGSSDKTFESGNGGGNAGSGQGGMLNTGNDNGQGGILNTEPACDNNDPNADHDGDGYTPAQGDCNDCTEKMNPGAYDYPNNGVDEDCSGTPDDEPVGCDEQLAIDSKDASDAARALGLCRFSSEQAAGKDKTWGVVSAKYVFADGSTASKVPDAPAFQCSNYGGQGSLPNDFSHGLLRIFGKNVKPRAGQTMVALSSGVARSGVFGDSPSAAVMCTRSATPSGFPTPSNRCGSQSIDNTPVANDPMALELKVRVPTNVKSMSFDFDFYTYEYPQYICTEYNDFFVALLYSSHGNVPANHNISFDAKNNPVSVNNAFLEVCNPGNHGGIQFNCALKTAPLEGTGFEDHAATGWLSTKSPVVPGEIITLRFAIWDAGDEVLDSTVLIDNFKWDVEEGKTETERPPVN